MCGRMRVRNRAACGRLTADGAVPLELAGVWIRRLEWAPSRAGAGRDRNRRMRPLMGGEGRSLADDDLAGHARVQRAVVAVNPGLGEGEGEALVGVDRPGGE